MVFWLEKSMVEEFHLVQQLFSSEDTIPRRWSVCSRIWIGWSSRADRPDCDLRRPSAESECLLENIIIVMKRFVMARPVCVCFPNHWYVPAEHIPSISRRISRPETQVPVTHYSVKFFRRRQLRHCSTARNSFETGDFPTSHCNSPIWFLFDHEPISNISSCESHHCPTSWFETAAHFPSDGTFLEDLLLRTHHWTLHLFFKKGK
jgi:hypothetical protein